MAQIGGEKRLVLQGIGRQRLIADLVGVAEHLARERQCLGELSELLMGPSDDGLGISRTPPLFSRGEELERGLGQGQHSGGFIAVSAALVLVGFIYAVPIMAEQTVPGLSGLSGENEDVIDAESIEGISGLEVTARGGVEFRQDATSVYADYLKFNREFGRLEAEGGVRLVQVRERELSDSALESFAREVVTLAHAHGARVLANGDAALAQKVGADGVHLKAAQLMRLVTPPPAGLWAASCHNAGELARAAALGADFVALSPVLPTASHPGQPGIGWEKFGELIRDYPLPVYALGGMKPEMLATARQHGAHGVSLLSGIW